MRSFNLPKDIWVLYTQVVLIILDSNQQIHIYTDAFLLKVGDELKLLVKVEIEKASGILKKTKRRSKEWKSVNKGKMKLAIWQTVGKLKYKIKKWLQTCHSTILKIWLDQRSIIGKFTNGTQWRWISCRWNCKHAN